MQGTSVPATERKTMEPENRSSRPLRLEVGMRVLAMLLRDERLRQLLAVKSYVERAECYALEALHITDAFIAAYRRGPGSLNPYESKRLDEEPPPVQPGDNCTSCGAPIDHKEPHTQCEACREK